MPTLITTSRGASASRKLVAPSGPDGVVHGGAYAVLQALRETDLGQPLELAGPAGVVAGGSNRIILEGWSSAPGTLYLETRTVSGGSWTASDSETLLAGETVRGIATTVVGEVEFRLRLVCPNGLPSKAHFVAQARP